MGDLHIAVELTPAQMRAVEMWSRGRNWGEISNTTHLSDIDLIAAFDWWEENSQWRFLDIEEEMS